jgi:trk/ktr system potassium uptake protein
MFFREKINIKGVLANLGLLFHVPGILALASIPIAFFFREYYAIAPFFIIAFGSILLGQVFSRFFTDRREFRLRDGMVTAAFGWILCPPIGACVFYWISHKMIGLGYSTSAVLELSNLLNAFFQSYSAFTTAGFSMVTNPSQLPHCLQWWASLSEWVGGLGLVFFVMTLIEPKSDEFQIFYAETAEKRFRRSLKKMTRVILTIYGINTLICILLFLSVGMRLWQAINHGMTGVSTGGLTITRDSFMSYSPAIRIAGLFVMIIGATSFVVYYKVLFQREFSQFLKNFQNRIFYILLISGGIIVFLINHVDLSVLNSAFLWFSVLGTCGYNSIPISEVEPILKQFLLIGMIIGGCSGSTVGGIKIRRAIQLVQGIKLRLRTIMRAKAEDYEYISPSIEMPKQHSSGRLYEASTLFGLWIATIFIGWMLLKILFPEQSSFDLLFETTSALGDTGLTAGFIGPDLPKSGKIIVIALFTMGRIEIIPMLVLFLSWPLSRGRFKKQVKAV